MKTGVVLKYGSDIEQKFKWCVENGIETCQLGIRAIEYNEETVKIIRSAVKAAGIEISALIGSNTGPAKWDFYDGPLTIGIVPPAWQSHRIKELAESARFAAELGVPRVCAHMGFFPENPNDPLYTSAIASVRWLAKIYEQAGTGFNFETGQETPVTLLRIIEDIGSASIGVNFDPANLLMYGKANPIDALDIIGKYIRGVHAKDGEYPDNPRTLGREKPLGEGRVNFPVFIQQLKKTGYDGPLTIEREIEGEKQKEDILKANKKLKELIGAL